jgi:hypothetical protein
MATRPTFLPVSSGSALVREVPVEFKWHPGMSRSQKVKNVHSLHHAAESHGIQSILEVSTASETSIGLNLSAINLTIGTGTNKFSFESAYQGSKVFSRGGPFTDIYVMDGRSAKRDDRIRNSGRIVSFSFRGEEYPITPPTAFYDWLYLNALYEKPELIDGISTFKGFTDISFNPERSLNCQARSCALISALNYRDMIDDAIESFGNFLSIINAFNYGIKHIPDQAFA